MRVSHSYQCFAFLAVTTLAMTSAGARSADATAGASDECIRLPSGMVIKLSSLEIYPKWNECFPPDRPWFAEKYPEGRLLGIHACSGARLNGPSVLLHENGTIKTIGFYPSGQQQGPFRVYDEDGRLLLYARYKDDKLHGVACLLKDGEPWFVEQWNSGTLESETIIARKGTEFTTVDDAEQLAQAHEKAASVRRGFAEDMSELKKRLSDCFASVKESIEREHSKALRRTGAARTDAMLQRERLEAVAQRHRYHGYYGRYGNLVAQDAAAARSKSVEVAKGEAEKLQQMKAAADKESRDLYHFALAALEKARPSQDSNRAGNSSAKLKSPTTSRPPAHVLAKAIERVREVYKDEIEKLSTSSEKTALAKELLKAADDVGDDDASRLALLTVATELAVQAHDAGVAMQAVTALVARFQPDGPAEPKEQIERGNALWKESQAASPDNRLGLQIRAAEWYLRARATASGFDKTIIEKRLADLAVERPAALRDTPPVPIEGKVASPAGVSQDLPTGWARIINRKTSLVLCGMTLRLERSAEFYKLKNRDSRLYVAITKGASSGQLGSRTKLLHEVSDSGSPTMLWKVEPRGQGYWLITNRATGQCLYAPDPNPASVVRQAAYREGDTAQEWRFEEVK